eukprot:13102800-Alexandrium_andersonii.AAC.1
MHEAPVDVVTTHVPTLPVSLVQHVDIDVIRQPEIHVPRLAGDDRAAHGVEAHEAPAAASATNNQTRASKNPPRTTRTQLRPRTTPASTPHPTGETPSARAAAIFGIPGAPSEAELRQRPDTARQVLREAQPL